MLNELDAIDANICILNKKVYTSYEKNLCKNVLHFNIFIVFYKII